jgi:hypothetical protein
MADLDQLQRLDSEIRVAECLTVHRLAERGQRLDRASEQDLVGVKEAFAGGGARAAERVPACARVREARSAARRSGRGEYAPSLGADFHLREIERDFRELHDDQDGDA